MAEQQALPSGSGGFMRYSDEAKSSFELTPGVVIGMCAAVAALMILLRLTG